MMNAIEMILVSFVTTFFVIYFNKLKFEHHGLHATFLDLSIILADGIYQADFMMREIPILFFVVYMPDLNGNIPVYVF